jgi:predicted sulfurtransferase
VLYGQARDIKGRIYVNEQGINAQLSGYGNDAVAYAEWVTSDPRFEGTRVSVYDAPAHSFPRLTLRYKANLVQLEGGTRHLDLSTPEARAHALSPQEWRVRPLLRRPSRHAPAR